MTNGPCGVSRGGPAGTRPAGWQVLAVVGVAGLLSMLDSTMLYAAMPQIGRGLGLRTGDLHWVMSCYLLGFGGILVAAPRIAGLLGRRRLFIVGIALFTVASVLGSVADTGAVLMAARVLQGAGAALMAPTMLPMLAITFRAGAGRGRAMGVWTVIGAFGGTAGLLVGGLLADGPGWRAIFVADAALGLLVTVASLVVLREFRGEPLPAARRPVGLAAVVTLTAAIGLLGYALTEGPRAGWTAGRTIGCVVLSIGALALFAVLEAGSRAPIVPPRLRRSSWFLGGLPVLFVAGAAADGLFLLLVLYLQEVLASSATRFGLVVTVLTLSSVAGSFAGQLLATRGLRRVAYGGMMLIFAGLLAIATTVDEGFSGYVFVGMAVFGCGLGSTFVAGQIMVVSGHQDDDSPSASGIADVAFTLGGVLGLATASSVLVAHGSDAVLTGASVSAAPQTTHLATAVVLVAMVVVLGGVLAGIAWGRSEAVLLFRNAEEAAGAAAPRANEG